VTIRIGFIGCGGIAARHAEGMKSIPEAEIVAAADVDEACAAKLTGGNAAVYTDWRRMLDAEELDAVYVCTPPNVHGDIEEALAGSVGAVMIEKPVANGMETARRALAAFEKAGTLAAAAYMNRYRRSAERAKELLSDPADSPVMANGWWMGGVPGVAWWRDRSVSGGQMSEQATHVVDLARWLVGEVDEVFAYGARGFVDDVPGLTVEDAVFMNLRFASGAVGNVSTGCFVKRGYASGMGVGLTVASRKVKCSFSGWGMALVAATEKGREERVEAQDDIFEIEDRAFMRAVAEKDPTPIRSPYADAARTLAVTLAANESMDTGKPVRPDYP
jgi:predicted dehydrogenase